MDSEPITTQEAEAEPVRTVCCWCKALIHDGVLMDGQESHGICEPCNDRWRAEAGLPARRAKRAGGTK